MNNINDTKNNLIINNQDDTISSTTNLDLNLQNNLLYKIKSNIEHPFYKLMAKNITDDFKSFYSEQRNKQVKIYGELNKTYLEDLAREIYYLTNNRLQINKKYINVETTINSNVKKRTDIICKQNDNVFYIIEFKVVSNSSLKEAKNQIFEYAQEFALNTNQKSDIFCSIVIMDIERIIQDPGLLDSFNNNTSIISLEENSMDEFGISIENMIFDISKKEFKEDCFKKSSCIPVLEVFEFNKIKSKAIIRNVIDSYHTITTTNAIGASNVRERLDITNKSKVDLCLSMFETIYSGYLKNDINILYKHSEQKTFLYIKDETIEFLDDNKIYVTSTNAALINGQQSTHVPFLIVESLNNIINSFFEPSFKLTSFDKALKNSLSLKEMINSNKVQSKDLIEKFICFLKQCYFNYDVEEVDSIEECSLIAYSKNSSIDMKVSELNMSSKTGLKYKYLTNNIYKVTRILCTYPNIQKGYCNYINDKLEIEIVNFIPLVILFKQFNLNRSCLELFKESLKAKTLKKDLKEKDFTKNINIYVKEISKNLEKSKMIDNLNKDLKNNDKNLKKIKSDLEELKKEQEDFYELLTKLTLEIENHIENLEDVTNLFEQKEQEEIKGVKLNNEIKFKEIEQTNLIRKSEDLISQLEILKNKYQTDFEIQNNNNEFDDICNLLIAYNKAYNKLKSFIDEFKKDLNLQEEEPLLLLSIVIIGKYYNIKFLDFEEKHFNDIYEVVKNIKKQVQYWNLKWTSIGNNLSDETIKNLVIKKGNDTNTEIISGEDFINSLFNYKEKTFEEKIELKSLNLNDWINYDTDM